uniref:PARP catalytic domain-containing protein n=1 Tax=Wuchereria bancrofti TaxID=6293 RepID=A0AAF5PKC6_WUCBA
MDHRLCVFSIVQKDFDERYSHMGGIFGAGSGCSLHRDCSYPTFITLSSDVRKIFYTDGLNIPLYRVPVTKWHIHHSMMEQPRAGGLNYPEYVIYRGKQMSNSFAYPEYVTVYRIVNDDLRPAF